MSTFGKQQMVVEKNRIESKTDRFDFDVRSFPSLTNE